MSLIANLTVRSHNQCELCNASEHLSIYEVAFAPHKDEDGCMLICAKCLSQIEKQEELDAAHWSCLTASMWSEVPAVQVTAWRMLNRLRSESWAADNLDMLYLDDEKLAWAKATGDDENDGSVDLHKDASGQVLKTGDTVILTKSLDVKGTSMNAKVGTIVKNIRQVPDNSEQIEGRIEGQVIVILTKFVRKH